LNHVHSLSVPEIQIRTGAASAIVRKRASLSRSARSAALCSVTSAIVPIQPTTWSPLHSGVYTTCMIERPER
jgi:hypothetical protein